MKKNLLLIACFALLKMGVQAQCNNLFFSEYVEGYYYNKALEIYNPTDDTIDMSQYQIHRWNNGTDIYDPNYTVVLAGYVYPKSTFVVVKDTIVPGEAPWYRFIAKANMFVTPSCDPSSSNRTMCHNGNDAFTLELTDRTIIDIFGEIGVDPGNPTAGGGWNNNPGTNYTAADSTGDAWTTDHTLIRKSDVVTGVIVNPSPFIVANQWDRYEVNMADSLGHHTSDCAAWTNGLNNTDFLKFEVYPNPVVNYIQVESPEVISSIAIIGFNGQSIINIDNVNSTLFSYDISQLNLNKGVYLIQVFGANEKYATKGFSVSQ